MPADDLVARVAEIRAKADEHPPGCDCSPACRMRLEMAHRESERARAETLARFSRRGAGARAAEQQDLDRQRLGEHDDIEDRFPQRPRLPGSPPPERPDRGAQRRSRMEERYR